MSLPPLKKSSLPPLKSPSLKSSKLPPLKSPSLKSSKLPPLKSSSLKSSTNLPKNVWVIMKDKDSGKGKGFFNLKDGLSWWMQDHMSYIHEFGLKNPINYSSIDIQDTIIAEIEYHGGDVIVVEM